MNVSQQQTLPYASWIARVGAGAIDLLFAGAVLVAWILLVRWSGNTFGRDPNFPNIGLKQYAEQIERTKHVIRVTLAVTGPLVLCALAGNSVVWQGRTGLTIGKRVTGLRLVDLQTGLPVGVGRALLRQVAHIVDALPCYIGYLWPLWDAQRQTIADKLTGTAVIASASEY